VLAFGVSVLWSAVSPAEVLESFRWRYIWAASFVRFVDYAIPVTAAGMAVAYSLFERRKREARRPFHRVVSAQLTGLVALAVLYTVVLFGFYPRSRTLMEQLENRSRLGKELLAKIEAAGKAGDAAAELEAIDRYLAVDPRNKEKLERRDELAVVKPGPKEQAAGAGDEAAAAERFRRAARGKKPSELLAEARRYFDREEWFSAHYYAQLAASVSAKDQAAIKQEAERLLARAWEKIRDPGISKDEKEELALFEAVRSGYEMLQREEFLAAYYHFLELRKKNPQDLQVVKLFDRSREEVAQVAYSLPEAERTEPLPGIRELLFVNSREGEEREIVSIGKMVQSEAGTFFKEVEVLRFSPRGVDVHFLSPYGKLHRLSDGKAKILLRGIGPEGVKRESIPIYLLGISRKTRPEERYILDLAPRPEELAALRAPGASSSGWLGSVGLDALWSMREKLEPYGHLQSALSLELLMRLLLPFAFLNLSLLAVVLGWAYRFGSPQRPPALAWVAIPVFPVAGALLTGLYLRVHRVLASFALLAWGITPALIALAVLQGAILAVMLVLLAGQASD